MKHNNFNTPLFEAWCSVQQWLRQMDECLAAEKRQDATVAELVRPDGELLVKALRERAVGGRKAIHAEVVDGGKIRLHLPKPRNEGDSIRDLDPEAAAFLVVLRFPGADIALEPKGNGNKYYGRFTVIGEADRRVVVVRIIAETPKGQQTDEPDDYHSWLRRDLCHRGSRPGDTPGEYGTEEAKSFAKDRFREVLERSPAKLPPGLTLERYAKLLDLAHLLMSRLPLGTRPA